jgi:hypothetical protein
MARETELWMAFSALKKKIEDKKKEDLSPEGRLELIELEETLERAEVVRAFKLSQPPEG